MSSMSNSLLSESGSIGNFLNRIMPKPYQILREVRGRYRWERKERRLTRIAKAIVDRYGCQVLTGPFAGMTYVQQSIGSVLIPKLLGSYEAELHEVLSRIISKNYRSIIDIGCAEGYYAIGLALRFPDAQVYAFDTEPLARQLCVEMARANGVQERIIMLGQCDVQQLSALSLEQSLIVCDVDGYEFELLHPALVCGLEACDLLIELHDHENPQITPALIQRFSDTHDIEIIDSVERDPKSYPQIEFLSNNAQHLAVHEGRPPQTWAYMSVKRSI